MAKYVTRRVKAVKVTYQTPNTEGQLEMNEAYIQGSNIDLARKKVAMANLGGCIIMSTEVVEELRGITNEAFMMHSVPMDTPTKPKE